MRASTFILLGLCALLAPATRAADEWPQFRGPDGAATGAGENLPAEWGPEKNVAWKAKVEARPAYKKMLEIARPDGLIGSPPALPKA